MVDDGSRRQSRLDLDPIFGVVLHQALSPKCSRSQDDQITDFDEGSRTVVEYDRAFTELARYEPHMVYDEYMKARKFESGLRGPIHD